MMELDIVFFFCVFFCVCVFSSPRQSPGRAIVLPPAAALAAAAALAKC